MRLGLELNSSGQKPNGLGFKPNPLAPEPESNIKSDFRDRF
jgi:hypothetical protein